MIKETVIGFPRNSGLNNLTAAGLSPIVLPQKVDQLIPGKILGFISSISGISLTCESVSESFPPSDGTSRGVTKLSLSFGVGILRDTASSHTNLLLDVELCHLLTLWGLEGYHSRVVGRR